jgi:hypothetical protein
MSSNCLTPGAYYHARIKSHYVDVQVDFGKTIDLTEGEAEVLEAELHDALAKVLAKYYQE